MVTPNREDDYRRVQLGAEHHLLSVHEFPVDVPHAGSYTDRFGFCLAFFSRPIVPGGGAARGERPDRDTEACRTHRGRAMRKAQSSPGSALSVGQRPLDN